MKDNVINAINKIISLYEKEDEGEYNSYRELGNDGDEIWIGTELEDCVVEYMRKQADDEEYPITDYEFITESGFDSPGYSESFGTFILVIGGKIHSWSFLFTIC